jgi:hypothetical protein
MMPAIIEPDGLVVLMKVIDRISPVKARADQSIKEYERFSLSLNAVEELRAVKAFDIAVRNRRPPVGLGSLDHAFFSCARGTGVEGRLKLHLGGLYSNGEGKATPTVG